MTKTRRSEIVIILLIILAIAAYYISITRNLYNIIQLKLYDSFWHTAAALGDWDNQPVYEDICIVDIGEQSIEELGQFSTWPNLFFADLVDSLAKDHPKLIAFDIFFSESDSLGDFGMQRMQQHLKSQGITELNLRSALSTDSEFQRAILDAGNVYLPMFGTQETTDKLVLLPHSVRTWEVKPENFNTLKHLYPPVHYLANAAQGIGLAHIHTDESGNTHHYPLFFEYEEQYLVNFGFQACLDILEVDAIHAGKKIQLQSHGEPIRTMPLDDFGRFHFRFYGSEQSFRYVQLADVIKGRMEPGFFRDKIVLVGSSAAGLRDTKPMPLSADMPGVELHATFMRNLLNEEYISWLPSWLGWLTAVLLLLASRLVIRRFKPVTSIGFFLGISLVLFIVLFIMFSGFYVAMPYSTLFFPWVIGFLAIMIAQSQAQHHERQKVKLAFEHYVSKAVINDILMDPNSLKVGGIKRHACIMFADIRNFSTLCETLNPDEVSRFLHDYFNRNTALVTKHNGMLDKYIGDAILALFNIPVDQSNYQMEACHCALEMIAEVAKIRQNNSTHPLLSQLRIGIGLASGSIIAGNLGSDEIFNYTGIGDKMNLASRLESLNKFYLTSIIVDNETWLATREHFHYRWLDRVCVKGKCEAVDIYELISSKQDTLPNQDAIAIYEQALDALCNTDVDRAERLFKHAASLAPNDPPTQVMLERVHTLDRDLWDGVYRHILK